MKREGAGFSEPAPAFIDPHHLGVYLRGRRASSAEPRFGTWTLVSGSLSAV
jgi:hypothetical protein